MISPSGHQLEIPGTAALQPSPENTGLLGIVLDEQAFLRFLSAEWLFPASGRTLLLGVGQACTVSAAHGGNASIWFDLHNLPDTTVMAWSVGEWRETTVANIRASDAFVAWTGPLPLFAVDHVEASSKSALVQLFALARSFADMTVPDIPAFVSDARPSVSPADVPYVSDAACPPENWDAVRGAAAMAAFALPAIDPWVDLFCEALREGAKVTEAANKLHAPWWRVPLWKINAESSEELPALWRAVLDEFGQRGRLREWRAKAILESICARARLLGEDEERLQRFSTGAADLLDDRGTVQEVGSHDDFLALTLQLVLLRPSPDKFATWRKDWPPIPPVVWWTGMTLAGYLQGYQSLPTQFRGTPESQKLLALRTWQFASHGYSAWNKVAAAQIGWDVVDDKIVLTADGKRWAEHKLGTRGSWYRADLDSGVGYDEAEALARVAFPEAISEVLRLTDAALTYGGTGSAKLVPETKQLTVKGTIDIPLGLSAVLERRLDVERFRDWMATASISNKLERPPAVWQESSSDAAALRNLGGLPANKLSSTEAQSKLKAPKKSLTSPRAKARSIAAPLGLDLVQDFISADEELVLVETIDSLKWDRSMKRRVQHYGWRYDYKKRMVDPKSYIGPLPDWAQTLAERLLELRVTPEIPDQVIVNNYEADQGISKHIDCLECFRGPVVTISLLESWNMLFTRKREGNAAEQFEQPLPRRSAAVISGEARSDWEHAIPVRVKDGGVPRGRRISITFRKVAL